MKNKFSDLPQKNYGKLASYIISTKMYWILESMWWTTVYVNKKSRQMVVHRWPWKIFFEVVFKRISKQRRTNHRMLRCISHTERIYLKKNKRRRILQEWRHINIKNTYIMIFIMKICVSILMRSIEEHTCAKEGSDVRVWMCTGVCECLHKRRMRAQEQSRVATTRNAYTQQEPNGVNEAKTIFANQTNMHPLLAYYCVRGTCGMHVGVVLPQFGQCTGKCGPHSHANVMSVSHQ